jgi:hypothetical protein
VNFGGNSTQNARCLLLVTYRVNFTGTSNLDNDCPDWIDDLDTSDRRIRIVE